MNKEIILNEVTFNAVRSGGPGGQHANKVSSKVIVQFNVDDSRAFTDAEKRRLLNKLSGKLSKDGVLVLTCDETRSQHQNKETVTKRLLLVLKEALIIPKRRIPTKVSRNAKTKRLDQKKKLGARKILRQKPKTD